MNGLTQRIWEQTVSHYFGPERATMSQHALHWVRLRALIDSVDNGGFASFFYNPTGDDYEATIAALKYHKADRALLLLHRAALLLFGNLPVPRDVDSRNHALQDRIESPEVDSALSELDLAFYSLESDLEILVSNIAQRVVSDAQYQN